MLLSLDSVGKESRSSILFLLTLVVVTRIPFLFLGFGSDGDAWRVAQSASMFWREGIYQPSRFPGFPIYEIFNSPLVGLGNSFLSNAATLLVFLLCIVLFQRIISKLKIPSGNLILWTFAFMPILWKNSSVTMDYVWGLMLILLSVIFMLEKKNIFSAIVLGIAAGTRLTHLIFLIPFLFILDNTDRVKKFVILCFVAGCVSIICYLPVLLRPELWLDIQKYIIDIRKYTLGQQVAFFGYRAIYTFGLLGSISILIFLFISRRRFKEAFVQNEKGLLFCIVAIGVLLVVFFFLADEKEYLIPAIPFLLMAIAIVFPSNHLQITCFLMLSYAAVNVDLIAHGFGAQRFSPNLSTGMVIKDYFVRKDFLVARETISNYPLPDSSVVLTGMGPMFWYENPQMNHTKNLEVMFNDEDASVSRLKPNIYFVYKLSYSVSQKFKKEGFQIYYLQGTKAYLESFLHYDLDTAGMRPLDIPLP